MKLFETFISYLSTYKNLYPTQKDRGNKKEEAKKSRGKEE